MFTATSLAKPTRHAMTGTPLVSARRVKAPTLYARRTEFVLVRRTGFFHRPVAMSSWERTLSDATSSSVTPPVAERSCATLAAWTSQAAARIC